MDEFFIKVKSTFPNCTCVRDDYDEDDETIAFYPRKHMLGGFVARFNLETFSRDMDKLVDEIPELSRRMHITIAYQVVDKTPKLNMFGEEIPHFTQEDMQFTCKRGEFTEATHRIFR